MSRNAQRAGWGIAASIAVLAGALVLRARSSPDPVTLAKRAYERGEWEGAAAALRGELKAQSGTPSDPEVWRYYARTLVRLGRDQAAGAIYEGRLGSAKLEPEDEFLKGLAMVRTGRPEAGLRLWENAEKAGLVHAEMLDHLSRLAFRFQRIDRALGAARKLSKQPGWEAKGLFLLGDLAEVVDDPPGVVAALEPALRLEPAARGAVFDAAHYRKLLVRNLLRLGRPAEAEQILTPARPDPAGEAAPVTIDGEAEWLLSRCYVQQGRLAEAAKALARSGPYGGENRSMPEPSPYIGSAACVPCHPAESRSYHATRHTRSFYRGAGLLGLPVPERPVPDPDDPRITHAVEREDDAIKVHSRIGERVIEMVVAYAFGTPQHYLTMIGRDEAKDYRALRVSYYQTADGSGWGPTSGDVGHSHELDDRRGQKIDVRDGMVRCLYCHVTRSRDFRDPPPSEGPGPEAADRGIGCERCHGPGGNHVKVIHTEFPDRAIVNVAGAPAATANLQCAECHTVGLPSQIEQAPDDPMYVRSPGVTFPLSRCSTESGGALSCMTCHDPHREADHSASFYETKCLSCHAPAAASAGAPAGATPAGRRAVCPVNPAKDCLGCHMPKLSVPTLHASLTDHYIRVRRSSSSPRVLSP